MVEVGIAPRIAYRAATHPSTITYAVSDAGRVCSTVNVALKVTVIDKVTIATENAQMTT
jgi:hypothetical protein